MGTLSFYLIVAFFSYYYFSPKKKTALWKYAILIPLITSVIYIIYSYASNDYNSFKAGQAFSYSIIPTIISGFVIYFLLKRKLINEGINKFPIILFVLIIITFGLGIYQNYQTEQSQEKIESILQEFDSSYSTKTTKQLPVTKEIEKQNALYNVRETAKQFKKQLPVNVGESTIMYNVEFDENKNDFITYYKETDLDKSELSQEDINL